MFSRVSADDDRAAWLWPQLPTRLRSRPADPCCDLGPAVFDAGAGSGTSSGPPRPSRRRRRPCPPPTTHSPSCSQPSRKGSPPTTPPAPHAARHPRRPRSSATTSSETWGWRSCDGHLHLAHPVGGELGFRWADSRYTRLRSELYWRIRATLRKALNDAIRIDRLLEHTGAGWTRAWSRLSWASSGWGHTWRVPGVVGVCQSAGNVQCWLHSAWRTGGTIAAGAAGAAGGLGARSAATSHRHRHRWRWPRRRRQRRRCRCHHPGFPGTPASARPARPRRRRTRRSATGPRRWSPRPGRRRTRPAAGSGW